MSASGTPRPTVKALYTATATATDGGRNGHTRTDDGKLDLELSMPEALGGPGGEGTNPEQLFAAGYAACFANAMRSVARRQNRLEVVEGATVTAHVDIGAIGGGRFGLAVRLDVAVPRLEDEEAEELVARAHERCPYSSATRGNIDVELAVRAGVAAAEA
jgi:lipoyl-dependent peroxiredoxin